MKRKAFAIVMSLLLLLSLVPVMSGAALAAFTDPDGNHDVSLTTTIPIVLGINVSPASIDFGIIPDGESSSTAYALDPALYPYTLGENGLSNVGDYGASDADRTLSVLSTGNCDQWIDTEITGEERTVTKEKLGYGNGANLNFGPVDYPAEIEDLTWTVYLDGVADTTGAVLDTGTAMVNFTSPPAGGVLVSVSYTSKSTLYTDEMTFDDAANPPVIEAVSYSRELVDDEEAIILSDISIPEDYPYGVDNIETATCTFLARANVGTNYILNMGKTGNGTVVPSVGAHSYADGTVVTVTATPAYGQSFDGWTGDVADPNAATTTVTMDANKTVTASFSQITHDLTMAVVGDGSTSPAVGTYTYNYGTVVPIVAIDGATASFSAWSGDVADPLLASTTVTMDADKTVTANFGSIEYTLTTAVSGSGTISPATALYTVGTVVTVTADPDDHQAFDGWTGDVYNEVDNGDGTYSADVLVDMDKAVTANFSQITHDLTMAVSSTSPVPGTTTPAVGVHTYNEGDVVNITAIPGYEENFTSWTGNVAAPGSATTTVTMDADETVTANFTMWAAPTTLVYESVYTDPLAVGGGNTSTWTIGVNPPAPYSTPYYNGNAIQLDVDYGATWDGSNWVGAQRMKFSLSCILVVGTIHIDAATNRMVDQGATVWLAGAEVTVAVTNEWMDDVYPLGDHFIAHTQLIGGGPPYVADEYHQTVIAMTTPPTPDIFPTVVPASPAPFLCVEVRDYMIGEERQYNGTSLGTGDGSTTAFVSSAGVLFGLNPGEEVVKVDGVRQYRGTDYSVDYGTATVTFTSAPAAGAVLTMDLNFIMYTTGGDPTTGRLWRIDYADIGVVGQILSYNYMYGYPDGEEITTLQSFS